MYSSTLTKTGLFDLNFPNAVLLFTVCTLWKNKIKGYATDLQLRVFGFLVRSRQQFDYFTHPGCALVPSRAASRRL
jgi:hypothetical protein